MTSFTKSSVKTATPATATPSSYEHVGRQAWIILWMAFFAFLVIVIGTPLLMRWYVQHATRPKRTVVESIRGAILVFHDNKGEESAVLDRMELKEGDIVRTDENARANITVTNGEEQAQPLASLQLRNNSEVVFQKAREPRFRRSTLPQEVSFRLTAGQARVTSNSDMDRPLILTVETPHGRVLMQDGDDAAISVNNEITEVSARGGSIEVEAEGQKVVLESGQRTVIALNAPPGPPQEGPINLVRNGDFSQPLEDTWQVEAIVDAGDPSAVEKGTVTVVDSGSRRAVYFVRDGEEGIHTETAIVQEINADVLDYDSLKLRMDVLILSQSLPGAGQQSSEFPTMARIDFIDVNGNPQFWTWGFYSEDPVANWPIRNGEKIPKFVWYDYESPDFLNSPTFPRPAKVVRIRIYASGHNYRSQASGIGLIAR